MKSQSKVIAVVLGVPLFLFLLLLAGSWLIFAPENWTKRKARFEKAGSTGMVVVAAIEKYNASYGKPPADLKSLVPDYLKEIPHTGLKDYPAFEYLVFTNTKSSLAWYDLGSRGGKPIAGLWVHDEGNPEHAILTFTLDQNDRVTDVRVDRMPQEHEHFDFNAEKWLRHESRIEMVRSLPNHTNLMGSNLAEVRSALGEPNEIKTVRNSPWELRIKCSGGILNWDVFFYWPTKDYPEQIYGGRTERIGEWAYVHE